MIRYLFEVHKLEKLSGKFIESTNIESQGMCQLEAESALKSTLKARNRLNSKYEFKLIRNIETIGDMAQSWMGTPEPSPEGAMERALLEFKTAALKVEEEWKKLGFDAHWSLSPGYPFHKSHDEMTKLIVQWVDGAVAEYLRRGKPVGLFPITGTEPNGIQFKAEMITDNGVKITVWNEGIVRTKTIRLEHRPIFGLDVCDKAQLEKVTDDLIKEVEEEMNK